MRNPLTFEERVLNELKNLRERIEKIEQGQLFNQPFGPITRPSMPIVTHPPKITCSKCGLVMDGPMGYCCSHRDCPCGMGPVWCGTSELK